MIKKFKQNFYERAFLAVSFMAILYSITDVLWTFDFIKTNNIENYSFFDLFVSPLAIIATSSILVFLHFRWKKSILYRKAEVKGKYRSLQNNIDNTELYNYMIKKNKEEHERAIKIKDKELKKIKEENHKLLERINRNKSENWKIAVANICHFWSQCILELEKEIDDKSFFMSFKCTENDYREAIKSYFSPKETFVRTAVDQSYKQWPALLSCERGEKRTKEERNIFRLRFGLEPLDETDHTSNTSKN